VYLVVVRKNLPASLIISSVGFEVLLRESSREGVE
jgi:hypothetical protein